MSRPEQLTLPAGRSPDDSATATGALPSFGGVTRLGFDTETDLEPPWRRELYGASYCTPDGRRGYVSVRHPGGPNHPAERVQDWLREELRGKELVVANAKHEIAVLRNFGADPEALGVRFRDVFHQASLLNERRRRVDLDTLAREELGRGKQELPPGPPVHERAAAEVADYAVEDARLALELDAAYAPRLAAEELTAVLDLEDDVAYVTEEMERNGTFLDVETLVRWSGEMQDEHERRILTIYRETGLRVNPGSNPEMVRLFRHLGLENPFRTAPTERHPSGQESFTEETLLRFAGHPTVKLVLEARQIGSLRAKYALKYLRDVEPNGRIRYQLHQLRGDEYGTITGRYSSSGSQRYGGINIQQVSVNEKQPAVLQRWPIRALFLPPPGEVWFSADASQIEFRLFAHYSAVVGSRRLIEAYNRDPRTDFHRLVMDWTGLIRGFAKNLNFAKLYGAGLDKIAAMLGVTRDEAQAIVRKYDAEFPEASRLLRLAADLAERRGYVRTLDGRRRRYAPGDRFHSALNAVFQGTAADIMKRKLRETHRAARRHGLTLRFTVHDELDGSLVDVAAREELQRLLDTQTTALRVPVLWDAATGKNWHEAHQ